MIIIHLLRIEAIFWNPNFSLMNMWAKNSNDNFPAFLFDIQNKSGVSWFWGEHLPEYNKNEKMSSTGPVAKYQVPSICGAGITFKKMSDFTNTSGWNIWNESLLVVILIITCTGLISGNNCDCSKSYKLDVFSDNFLRENFN